MTDFIIEHQCPQCGAPAELEETDRLFKCEFCRVNSYLTTPEFFRYVLPHKAPAGKSLIYYPYWRFKGMLFSCLTRKIEHRFLDLSHQALRSNHFPVNIGFRGQTQKLRFATDMNDAIFIQPNVAFKDILAQWTGQYSARLPKPIIHQDYIGETHSLVYAPYYLEDKIYDATLNQPVSNTLVTQIEDGLLQADNGDWPLEFIATICPGCGWDLEGERDSLALNCTNCRSVWWARNGELQELKAAHVPETGDDWAYLPFWRIRADISHLELKSYADLIKVANLAKVAQPGQESQPFCFWNPAFKVRPQSYLTIATNVTLNQPSEAMQAGRPNQNARAVNLPLQEAIESLKLSLASFIKPQSRRVENIPQIEIKPRSFLLVYLPFRDSHHELVHPKLKLAVHKNTLAHAKNL